MEQQSVKLQKFAYIFLVSSFITGCASPTFQKKLPEPSQGKSYALSKSEMVETTNHMTQHLNAEKSIVYFQNQGGGGVGLGLLLGPIGVAANMKMIEGITQSDAIKLKEKISINPALAFKKATEDAHFQVASIAEKEDIRVTPYVLVSKYNEDDLGMSSVVIFEGTNETSKWRSSYRHQLPGKYKIDELATLDSKKITDIQNQITISYESLLKHIKSELNENIEKEKKIIFKSPYLSPRFEFDMAGSLIKEDEGHVWIRTMGGVFSVNREEIQYEIQN